MRIADGGRGDLSDNPMQVLVIASYVPYPANHGAALDIWKRIQTLRELGCAVDLVATGLVAPDSESLNIIEANVRNFYFVQRIRNVRATLGIIPYQVASRRRLRTVHLKITYDIAILESEYVSAILQNKTLSYRHLVLRVHNSEKHYFSELAKTCSTLPAKAFYALESFRFSRYSPRIMSACEQLWFISDHEREAYADKHTSGLNKAVFLPPRIGAFCAPCQDSTDRVALFVGGLNIPMNIAGIRWYVNEVHPLLRNKMKYHLVIAGLTQGSDTEWLDKLCAEYADISVHKDVENLSPIYRSALVFVNPVSTGAGLKLKTIEAIANGLPVISTTNGVQGTGLVGRRHIYIADTPEEFVNGMIDLLGNFEHRVKLIRAAQEYIALAYDQRRVIQSCIAELTKPPALQGGL